MAARRKVMNPESERTANLLKDVRKKIIHYLTTDIEKGNGIFDANGGWCVWSEVNLTMVMGQVDRAIEDVLKERS